MRSRSRHAAGARNSLTTSDEGENKLAPMPPPPPGTPAASWRTGASDGARSGETRPAAGDGDGEVGDSVSPQPAAAARQAKTMT